MRTRRRVSTARSARPPTAAPRAVWRAKKRSLGQPVAWLRPRVQAPRELMAAEPPPPTHTHTRNTVATAPARAHAAAHAGGARRNEGQQPALAVRSCLLRAAAPSPRARRSYWAHASPPPQCHPSRVAATPASQRATGGQQAAGPPRQPAAARCCSAARSPACRPSRRPPATPHPLHRTSPHPHLPLPRRAAAAAPLRRAEQRGAHRWRNAGCLPRAAAAHCVPHARFNADECSGVET